jgi:RNA polymerase sigma-70 factor (ECF subfamily)
MSLPHPATRTAPHSDRGFVTTHWSIILRAGGAASKDADAALEDLCRAYWYPLYAYVRRQGHSVDDAQDLTQNFFARFLERKSLRLADRSRGRFRTFLLTSLKNFLINEWKKSHCEKRGGGRQIISLNAEETETRFLAEPADERAPDKAFERQWALVVLDRVLSQMQAGFAAAGRGQVFEELKSYLTGEDNESSCTEIGRRLGMTEGNLRVTIHRLRGQYRDLLREEVARTVETAEAIEEEIRHLISALSD